MAPETRLKFNSKSRVLSADVRNRHAALGVILFLLVCAACLPSLIINYGSDGDAIRGVIAARELAQTGTYHASRNPGNPLFEYSLVLPTQIDRHFATNLFVFAFFPLCMWAFLRLCRARPNAIVLFSVFSLTPILLVNASTTMDYIPGLALLLWSYVLVKEGRILEGFALLGLAAGMRPTNIVFVIPLAAFMRLSGRKLRDVFTAGIVSVAVGICFYIPILIKTGIHIVDLPFTGYKGIAHFLLTGYKGLMLFGPVATAVIAALLVVNRQRIRDLLRSLITEKDPEITVEFMTIALFTGIFVWHSDESEYLIPAVPFLYLFVERVFPAKHLPVLSACILSFAFISVDLKDGESGRRSVSLKPDWGILVKDYIDRKGLERLRSGICDLSLPKKAVIIHGYGPMLHFENPCLKLIDYRKVAPGLDPKGISDAGFTSVIPGRQVYLISGLSKENAELLRSQGYDLYYFSESAPSLCMFTYGYHPESLGMIKIDVKSLKK
jgi:hypothetical protein